jgi:hypothetical protein
VSELGVDCRPSGIAGGWACDVVVGPAGAATRHTVTVAAADLARLDPAASDPGELVERSFRFLLEREPNTSILRSFDLLDIAEYFPEFETSIRAR